MPSYRERVEAAEAGIKRLSERLSIGGEEAAILKHLYELIEELEEWDESQVPVPGEPLVRYEVKSGAGLTLFLWELGVIWVDRLGRARQVERTYINGVLCGLRVNGRELMGRQVEYLEWVRANYKNINFSF